jgi:hypothetical protein
MALISDLAEMVRNCLSLREEENSDFLQDGLPEGILPQLRELSTQLGRTEWTWMFDELLDLHQSLRQHSRFQRELAEVGFVRITEGRPRYNLSEITDRLEALQTDGGSGTVSREDTSSPAKDRPPSPKSDSPSRTSSDTPSSSAENEATSATDEDSLGSDGNSSSPDSLQLEDLESQQWETFLQAVKNPTRAFLKNCTAVRRDGDVLEIRFDGQHANQIERLKKDRQQEHLRTAMLEVFDREFEIELNVTDVESSEPEEVPELEDEENEEEEEFLRQSRELLESE